MSGPVGAKKYKSNWQQGKYIPSKSNTTRLGYGVSAEDEVPSGMHLSTAFFNLPLDVGLKAPEFGTDCTVIKAKTTNMTCTMPRAPIYVLFPCCDDDIAKMTREILKKYYNSVKSRSRAF